jgi:hypothetical protein
MHDFVLGQIPEHQYKLGKLPISSYASYLDIRLPPFGLMPILTVVEHYCTGGVVSLPAFSNIALLKNQVVKLAIPQNDIGGLEKDMSEGNVSNSLLVLAKLAGRTIEHGDNVAASADLLYCLETEHDTLLAEVLRTCSTIQDEAATDGELLMSNMMQTLCVTHLEWTLSTARYRRQS